MNPRNEALWLGCAGPGTSPPSTVSNGSFLLAASDAWEEGREQSEFYLPETAPNPWESSVQATEWLGVFDTRTVHLCNTGQTPLWREIDDGK